MNRFWILLALVVVVSCEKQKTTEKPVLEVAKTHDSVDHHHFPAKIEQLLPPKKEEKPSKDLKESDSIGLGFYAGVPISYGYYPYYPYYRRPYYGYYGVYPGFGFRAFRPIVGGGVIIG